MATASLFKGQPAEVFWRRKQRWLSGNLPDQTIFRNLLSSAELLQRATAAGIIGIGGNHRPLHKLGFVRFDFRRLHFYAFTEVFSHDCREDGGCGMHFNRVSWFRSRLGQPALHLFWIAEVALDMYWNDKTLICLFITWLPKDVV